MPIKKIKTGVGLEHGFAEVGDPVPGAVAGHKIDIARGVDGGSITGHPYSRSIIVRREIEECHLGERRRAVGEDEPLPFVLGRSGPPKLK